MISNRAQLLKLDKFQFLGGLSHDARITARSRSSARLTVALAARAGRFKHELSVMKDKQFSSKQQGTHTTKRVTIAGRVQIDLYRFIQQEVGRVVGCWFCCCWLTQRSATLCIAAQTGELQTQLCRPTLLEGHQGGCSLLQVTQYSVLGANVLLH